MAAPETGLTIIKQMGYRGDTTEEWSNHYWLTGPKPVDISAWNTVFAELLAVEKTLYPPHVTVVGAYGYDSVADDRHAVWSVDYTVPPATPIPGTYVGGTNLLMPGDSAVWVRWSLDRRNSKGKTIYLRKYFHAAYQQQGAAADNVATTQISALNTFGNVLQVGLTSGRKICDTQGNVPIAHGQSAFITTRTLKRRGKRPPT